MLADFIRAPRTIVVSTHLIDEVAPRFEETIILDRGRLWLQNETDALRARRGSGPEDQVDALLAGETLHSVQRLGSTKSAVIISDRVDQLDADGRHAGIEVEPVGLQDLFVYLTQEQEVVTIQ